VLLNVLANSLSYLVVCLVDIVRRLHNKGLRHLASRRIGNLNNSRIEDGGVCKEMRFYLGWGNLEPLDRRLSTYTHALLTSGSEDRAGGNDAYLDFDQLLDTIDDHDVLMT